MTLTIVTRSNVGYMNSKCELECDKEFAIEVAKKMFNVSKNNKYVEIYQGDKLYYGDSQIKPWIKVMLQDSEWKVEQLYEYL